MFAMLLYLQERLAFKNRLIGIEVAVDMYVTVWYFLSES